MSWQTPFLLYAAIVAVVTYIARRLKAPAWLAVCIPNVPIGLFFGWSVIFNIWGAGEGGALPLWIFTGPLFGVGLVASLIIIFVVPKRHDKPSA